MIIFSVSRPVKTKEMASMKFKLIGLLLMVVTVTYMMFQVFKEETMEVSNRKEVVIDDDFSNVKFEDVVDYKLYYSNSSLLIGQHGRVSETCVSGHIANMAPVCGTDGCLKVRILLLL